MPQTARSTDVSPAAAPLSLLGVRCGGRVFALDVSAVDRASWLVAVHPLPSAPDWVIGLARLAGEPVPMLDLARCLGLDRVTSRYALDTPVVWVRAGDRAAGLVVDEILDVVDAEGGVLHLRDFFTGGRPLLRGVAMVSAEQWLLLDARRVVEVDLGTDTIDLALDPTALQAWIEAGA